MKITDMIGSGAPYEPPFRLKTPSNVLVDYAIEDSTGTPVCWGFYNTVMAQHVCDLLNKEHETRRTDTASEGREH